MEEMQNLHQHPHVAPRDDHAGGGLEQVTHGLPVRRDHRPLLRAPGRVEVPLRSLDSQDVPLVHEAYDCHGVGQSGVRGARSAARALRDGVDRAKGMIELHEIELLQLVEDCAVLRLGGCELAVAFEDVQPATVQLEVDASALQKRLELLVVRLAFLPPCGDDRDPGVGPLGASHLIQGGPTLWAQYRDEALGGTHAACTCTVRPTSSSSPCSTS